MSSPRLLAFLGDLHSNVSALEAVLSLVDLEGATEIYCVGDLVGYGPRPNETIDLVRGRDIKSVAGNHDWAVLNKIDSATFNPYAKVAVEWTRKKLSKDNMGFLEDLPLRLDDPSFTLFHGALPHPEEFDYLQSFPAARSTFSSFETPVGFCGHTHVPMNFLEKEGGQDLEWHFETEWRLEPGLRAIVNVGSPGQPRDENPQAPVVFFSPQSGKIKLLRTPYNIAEEQKRIRKAGLPAILGDRLKHGI